MNITETNITEHEYIPLPIWFHIQIIFSSWFYLIIVTSKNSLPNDEHDPNYYKRSQSNLVKAFFVLHGEVMTGFKHSFKKQPPKVFYKKSCS